MMRNRSATRRLELREKIVAAYLGDYQDEMLDAVITAAALVSRADNWVQPVERSQLLDFLDRNEFLSIASRADISAAFERCIRDLREPFGVDAALARLSRLVGRLYAPLVIEAGEEVAAADCRIDPREQLVLDLIRRALGEDPSRERAADPSPSRRP